MAGEAGVAVIVWLGNAILLFEPTRTPRCFNKLQYPVSRAVASQGNDLRDVRQCPKDAQCHATVARAQGPALELGGVGAKGVRVDDNSLNFHDFWFHASKSPSTRGPYSGLTSDS
jgi:hypothetical protein